MQDVLNDFNQRVNEINKYFDFLKDSIDLNAILYFPNKRSHKEKEFDDELKKILKANSFLLLYNLVESSFTQAMEVLSNTFNDREVNYQDSLPELRKIWLQCEAKYFTTIPPNGGKKLDYVYSIIDDISNQVLKVPTNLKSMNVSGNLDAKKIRECVEMFGIKTNSITNKPSDKLITVKQKRNNLAHGDESFCTCGREYTYSELLEIKKQVIPFMRLILNTVKTKLNNDYFRIAT